MMATAKTSRPPERQRTRQRGRPLWLKALVLLAVAGLAAFLIWREPIMGLTRTGAAYGAHVACSCRYIAGRDIKDCKKDFEPGMAAVFLSDHPDERAVTAYVPLLAAETASHRPGYGCVLDPLDE